MPAFCARVLRYSNRQIHRSGFNGSRAYHLSPEFFSSGRINQHKRDTFGIIQFLGDAPEITERYIGNTR